MILSIWRLVRSSRLFSRLSTLCLLLQGFALTISHTDLVTPALPKALMRVLTNASFMEAARRVSMKLRTRARTPLQEAVGACQYLNGTAGPCMGCC